MSESLPSAEKDALHSIWRELAEKRIEGGVDWPRIVLDLFKSLDAAEANIREQVAREIEDVAVSGVHASDEPVFVDAALVARGRWNG